MRKLALPFTAIAVLGLAGLSLIKDSEGLRRVVYLDSTRIPTVCWGHTGPDVKMGQPERTVAQCEALFQSDLAEAVDGLNACVTRPLNANQSAALASFAFNFGYPRTCKSTLVKKINSGDFQGAAQEFPKWGNVTVNGKLTPVRGLQTRRKREADLFTTPVTANTQTVDVAALKRLLKG